VVAPRHGGLGEAVAGWLIDHPAVLSVAVVLGVLAALGMLALCAWYILGWGS
jgi:hypothetical protein